MKLSSKAKNIYSQTSSELCSVSFPMEQLITGHISLGCVTVWFKGVICSFSHTLKSSLHPRLLWTVLRKCHRNSTSKVSPHCPTAFTTLPPDRICITPAWIQTTYKQSLVVRHRTQSAFPEKKGKKVTKAEVINKENGEMFAKHVIKLRGLTLVWSKQPKKITPVNVLLFF